MKKLLPVLLLTLVNTLSFSLLIPVIPVMLRNWQMPDWTFGLILALFSFCQFWAAPIFGALSDQFGRRNILLITQGGTFISWLLFVVLWFVESMLVLPVFILLAFLIVLRVVDGLTGGNSSVTNAYLSDITSKAEKARYFGYLSATMGVGMIVGPAIGAYTIASQYGYLLTALVGGLLSLLTLGFIAFGLQESLKDKARASSIDWFKPFKLRSSFSDLKGQKVVKNILIVRIFLGATLASYTSVMVFYLLDQFALTEIQIGNFLFFVGGFAIFNQLVLIQPIVSKLGEARALALGLFLLFIGLLSFPYVELYSVLLCVYYLANLGFSICLPTIKSVLTTQTDPTRQGSILGLEESLGALTMAVMPIISTSVYLFIGVKSFWIWGSLSGLACVFLLVTCQGIWSKSLATKLTSS
ncbi:MFS transporter [Glaciecola sp. MH2013]|uniref:MFS transporter n=1 Tax=Glaciecola sp. MH2013 TaxID=2785524 RepID=UPI0018A02594|nr:MFS transporter [Glaciecola sp. MH2013]MBF7073589.1 MFS transporter [Glaciecola sp. MH2013]